MRKIYLDSAASTYVSNDVLQEMLPVFTTDFANSASVHNMGTEANNLVEIARERIAKGIKARSASEIYFTGSGTEANNLAILGAARANKQKGKHIIATKIEHPSVLECLKVLETEGFKITYLTADENGMVSMIAFLHALRPDTILVTCMMASSEVGTIQNIRAMSKVANDKGILFHTDAVAALGNVPINAEEMGIDLLSISAHKVYGPKGVGALYVREGTKLQPIIYGGGQEKGLRSGSTNVPAIVGFGKAVELATRDIAINNQKCKQVRDYFIKKVTETIPFIQVNGHPMQRLPNIVSISFDMIEGESIVMLLADAGIAASTGSACNSNKLQANHVLTAMRLPMNLIHGSVRFSFLKNIQIEEVDYVVKELDKAVKRLREMSPIKRSKLAK
ncbi:MAG: cysteine desulfurase [Firmicutes bacterium]|nr:cysteine desulfurase [Bacillota bacterium]